MQFGPAPLPAGAFALLGWCRSLPTTCPHAPRHTPKEGLGSFFPFRWGLAALKSCTSPIESLYCAFPSQHLKLGNYIKKKNSCKTQEEISESKEMPELRWHDLLT